MVDLDNTSAYRRFDKLGMIEHLHRFPEQCQKAWERILTFELPPGYAQISNVVIVGMGGSAIGGDIVRRLALSESRVPVRVHREYGLPAFVDERTVDVHIGRLRRALIRGNERDPIRTVRSAGYVFGDSTDT